MGILVIKELKRLTYYIGTLISSQNFLIFGVGISIQISPPMSSKSKFVGMRAIEKIVGSHFFKEISISGCSGTLMLISGHSGMSVLISGCGGTSVLISLAIITAFQ